MEPFLGSPDYLRIIPSALEPKYATQECFAMFPHPRL